jgi:hypothetical protein
MDSALIYIFLSFDKFDSKKIVFCKACYYKENQQ